MTARRGYLLAEALCALALAGVLALAAAGALTGVRRATAAAEVRARAERAGREALLVVAALTRDADSVLVLADTAIELSVRVASGVVCGRGASGVTLTPMRVQSGRPLSARTQPIEAGDEIALLAPDSLLGVRRWMRSVIDSADERVGDPSCTPGGGLVDVADAGVPRVRLVLRALDSVAVAGMPVRVGRRGRLALYYVGRGEWMLGWRRCAVGVCGVVQPVAGPLRSPASGGFRVFAGGVEGGLVLSVRVPGIEVPFEAQVRAWDARR